MLSRLKEIINNSSDIVFFGGAGVSTESGIPDFRSADGLYMMNYKYPPESILSHTFFTEHTKEFFEFYRKNMIFTDAKPNAAHLKLAELEKANKLKAVVTQNIDGLHTAAGSKTVFELHGSTLRNYCMKCGKFHGVESILKSADVPKCECGGIIKPDVVLYEESLDEETVNGAINAIKKADTLIVAGTSLRVYPAAGFIRYFSGDNLILINKDSTEMDNRFDLIVNGKIGEILSLI